MEPKGLIPLSGSLCGSNGSRLYNALILLNGSLRKAAYRSLRIYFGSRALHTRHPNTIRFEKDLCGGVA